MDNSSRKLPQGAAIVISKFSQQRGVEPRYNGSQRNKISKSCWDTFFHQSTTSGMSHFLTVSISFSPQFQLPRIPSLHSCVYSLTSASQGTFSFWAVGIQDTFPSQLQVYPGSRQSGYLSLQSTSSECTYLPGLNQSSGQSQPIQEMQVITF